MKIGNRGLVFAMEEEQLIESTPAEVTAVEPEIVPTEVEQEVSDVVVDGGEADELNAAIEEAVEDVGELESVGDTLEQTVEEGGEGVAPEAAEIAEIAVESLARRLGIRSAKPIPAMESFGSTNSRVSATRIAVEGIKEMAVKAWEAIKVAFKSLWEKVKAFLDRIFNVNTRLKAAAEAALKRVSELGDKKAAAADFENSNIARAFNIDGKTGAQVAESILANHTLVLSGLVELGVALESAMKSIGEAVASAKAAKESTSKEVNEEIGLTIRDELTKTAQKLKGLVQTGGDKVERMEPLAFNTTMTIVTVASAEGSQGFVHVQEGQVTTKEPAKKVPTLTADEMKKVLEAVIGLAAENEKLKAKKDFTVKFEATANKVIAQAISAAGKLEGNEEFAATMKFRLQYARRATADLGNVFGKLGTKVPGLSVQAAKAGLNYVDASLKQYKAEKAAPAAAE